jgi:hypothetical protein
MQLWGILSPHADSMTLKDNAALPMQGFAGRMLDLRQPGTAYMGQAQVASADGEARYRIHFTRDSTTNALIVALMYDESDVLARVNFGSKGSKGIGWGIYDRGASLAARRSRGEARETL